MNTPDAAATRSRFTPPSVDSVRLEGLRSWAVILFLLAVCGSLAMAEEEKDWKPLLTCGYAEQDPKPLLEFVESWHKQSKPVEQEMLRKKPALERSIYELFQAFYKPAKGHYKITRYAVIQDTVSVTILDSDLQSVFDKQFDREGVARQFPTISQLSFADFRPRLELKGKRVLYLNADRLAVILGFLTNDNGYRMLDRYWQVECESKEKRRKLAYLNMALKVFRGHWGAGWHFITHPRVDTVYLSSDLKSALVCYRVYYGGGEALMKRGKDGWKVILSENTWVE